MFKNKWQGTENGNPTSWVMPQAGSYANMEDFTSGDRWHIHHPYIRTAHTQFDKDFHKFYIRGAHTTREEKLNQIKNRATGLMLVGTNTINNNRKQPLLMKFRTYAKESNQKDYFGVALATTAGEYNMVQLVPFTTPPTYSKQPPDDPRIINIDDADHIPPYDKEKYALMTFKIDKQKGSLKGTSAFLVKKNTVAYGEITPPSIEAHEDYRISAANSWNPAYPSGEGLKEKIAADMTYEAYLAKKIAKQPETPNMPSPSEDEIDSPPAEGPNPPILDDIFAGDPAIKVTLPSEFGNNNNLHVTFPGNKHFDYRLSDEGLSQIPLAGEAPLPFIVKEADGKYAIPVPAGITLQEGGEVSAHVLINSKTSKNTIKIVQVVPAPADKEAAQYHPQATRIEKNYGQATTDEEVLAAVTISDYPTDKKMPHKQVLLEAGKHLPNGTVPGDYSVPVRITYLDQSTTEIDVPITVKSAKDSFEPIKPDKTPVNDILNLNETEKNTVKKKLEDVNKGHLPDNTDFSIGNDGMATITYPDGSIDTIPGKELVKKKGRVRSGDQQTSPSIEKKIPQLNLENHYSYMAGYPTGEFRPNNIMTRAEVAMMFSRLLANRPVAGQIYSHSYSDVANNAWYATAVSYMNEKGLVSGYPDGTFRPDAKITRAEFATMASRFAKLTEANAQSGKAFNDVGADYWASKVISELSGKEWINGYPDGSFKPEQAITRAEVVSVTNKMLNRFVDKAFIDKHATELKQFSDLEKRYWAYYEIIASTNGYDIVRDKDGKNGSWTKITDKTFIY